MLVVLLGTLLPLVHKQLGLGSISGGEPFFNTMFTADMVPLPCCWGGAFSALGPGPARNIRKHRCSPPRSPPQCCRYFAMAAGRINHRHMTAVGMAMACWIAVLAVKRPYSACPAARNLSYWGMVASAPRAGGDDYRHRLQPELQRGRDACGCGRATA